MTKERPRDILFKHINKRYADLPDKVRVTILAQFPVAAVLSAMEECLNQETASLQSENESLRAALKELVELKDMEDSIEKGKDKFKIGERGLAIEAFYREYEKRKPLAWEQARKLSNPK